MSTGKDVLFGKTCVAVEQPSTDGPVKVFFGDGTVDEADLVSLSPSFPASLIHSLICCWLFRWLERMVRVLSLARTSPISLMSCCNDIPDS